MAIEVTFLDSGREPVCPPDPKFPDGRVVDFGVGADVNRCAVELIYPAPRCGAYVIRCTTCGMSVAVTVAGRVDDPRTVAMPCKPSKREVN
jgi:hypothetical protein